MHIDQDQYFECTIVTREDPEGGTGGQELHHPWKITKI